MNRILAFITLILFTSTAVASDDPSKFLEKVAGNMISKIEQNKEALKTDVKLAEKLVKETLLPAIDTNSFAKRTLNKSTWKKLSDDQKKRFVAEFINLVVGSYAQGLALYDGQEFKFSKPHFSKTGKSAKVRSSMEQASGSPIIIDYTLSIKTESWKITNLVIEGIDMSKSYKSQFLPRVKTMGIEGFIAEMEAKSS
jgi:phospholipid transport system substrate-binding protein